MTESLLIDEEFNASEQEFQQRILNNIIITYDYNLCREQINENHLSLCDDSMCVCVCVLIDDNRSPINQSCSCSYDKNG